MNLRYNGRTVLSQLANRLRNAYGGISIIPVVIEMSMSLINLNRAKIKTAPLVKALLARAVRVFCPKADTAQYNMLAWRISYFPIPTIYKYCTCIIQVNNTAVPVPLP